MPIRQGTDKDDVVVKGDDGTAKGKKVGMVGDCLKTHICNPDDIGDSDDDFSGFPCWSPTLRYEDMGPGTGGISRNTNIGSSWTTIYNVTGSGLFGGFLCTVEDPDEEWFIRLTIDGNEIFLGTTGLSFEDMKEDDRYGFDFDNSNDEATQRMCLGLSTFHDTLCFDQFIKYTSSIIIRLRKTDGSERWRAGLVRRSI